MNIQSNIFAIVIVCSLPWIMKRIDETDEIVLSWHERLDDYEHRK